MKKSLITIILSIALLSSCGTKDNSQPLEEAKKGFEIITNKVANKDKTISEKLEDPDTDIEKIANDFFKTNYQSPSTVFEKYLVDSAKNSGVDEKEALIGLLGYLKNFHQETGIKIDSIPIYQAIQSEAYQVAYIPGEQDSSQIDIGLEYPDIPIKNFNAFIDRSIAEDYRSLRDMGNFKNFMFMHEKYNHTEDDPLFKQILFFSGEYGYNMEEREYPGGIKAYTSIGADVEGVSCFFTYITTEDKHPAFNETSTQLIVVPLSYVNKPMTNLNGTVSDFKFLHLVTGPGFKDF